MASRFEAFSEDEIWAIDEAVLQANTKKATIFVWQSHFYSSLWDLSNFVVLLTYLLDMRRIGIFLGLFFLCVAFAIVFYRFSFQHLFLQVRGDFGVYFNPFWSGCDVSVLCFWLNSCHISICSLAYEYEYFCLVSSSWVSSAIKLCNLAVELNSPEGLDLW